jgi:hypothetical protein
MKNTISRHTLVKNSMNMKQTNKKLQILGAVALTAALATQAKADINYQISDYSMEYASISINGGSSYQNELAGGLGITEISSSGSTGNAPSSYVALCTDFGGTVYFGNTYTYSPPVSTSPAPAGYTGDPAWNKQPYALENAATLAAVYGSAVTSGNLNEAAGLQLAIWSALYDSTGVGTVNTSGIFRVAAGSAAYTDMNTYLTGLIALTPTSVEILLPDPIGSPQGNADGNPPQGLFLVAPVPEASSMRGSEVTRKRGKARSTTNADSRGAADKGEIVTERAGVKKSAENREN